MNVQIATLCDAANTDANSKLNVLGTFDQIFSESEPILYPSCTLVVKIQFERIEEGTKALKIMCVDEDGKPVFPTVQGNMEVKMLPDIRTSSVQIVGQLQQLKFPHFGEYTIDVALDGIVVASVPLYVRQLPKQKQ